MAVRKNAEVPSDKPRRPPATTIEGRENQLINLAYEEAERQIRAGNATSQLLTHFLKMGTSRELLEKEKLRNETALAQAKVASIASTGEQKELYERAIRAMSMYQGNEPDEDFEL